MKYTSGIPASSKILKHLLLQTHEQILLSSLRRLECLYNCQRLLQNA